MDQTVEARAKELAEAIKRTEAYREWVKARDELRQHYAAQVMLRNLHEAQLELMRKIQAGEAIGPEDEERWQRTAELVAYNPYVSAVLRAEQAMAELIAEVNEAIARELGLACEDSTRRGDDNPPPARGKLWVPGQP